MQYNKYLKTEDWKIKREECFKLHLKRCFICRNKLVDVHHKTYKRIFKENIEIDLIPLCRNHHKEVHDFSKKNNVNIYNATEIVIKKYKKKKKLLWIDMSPIEQKKLLTKSNW